MATLVLTTVGGAIGGPIGAAVGAVLGQRVDAGLLAPKGRQGPRLSELKVQTSSYGTQVPKVFGRMRVAGCVIWATDLIEQRGALVARMRAAHDADKAEDFTAAEAELRGLDSKIERAKALDAADMQAPKRDERMAAAVQRLSGAV